MFMCLVNRGSVINLDLTWEQSFLIHSFKNFFCPNFFIIFLICQSRLDIHFSLRTSLSLSKIIFIKLQILSKQIKGLNQLTFLLLCLKQKKSHRHLIIQADNKKNKINLPCLSQFILHTHLDNTYNDFSCNNYTLLY